MINTADIRTRLLNLAVESAEEAGRHLLRRFERPKQQHVRRKNDYRGSIVTDADLESERLIISKIKTSRIKCSINSEESGLVNLGSKEIVWAIDPLDGTFNYVKRIPYFAVSISAAIKGEYTIGVIYNPIMGEIFTASKGNGAHLNGKPIHVSNRISLVDSSLIFDWWGPEPLIPVPTDLERRLLKITRNIRAPGSIALNLCSVAMGRFDGIITVFARAPVYETSAGCLIIQESGGPVTNSHGETWEGFNNSIIGGAPRIQEKLLSLIQRSGARIGKSSRPQ